MLWFAQGPPCLYGSVMNILSSHSPLRASAVCSSEDDQTQCWPLRPKLQGFWNGPQRPIVWPQFRSSCGFYVLHSRLGLLLAVCLWDIWGKEHAFFIFNYTFTIIVNGLRLLWDILSSSRPALTLSNYGLWPDAQLVRGLWDTQAVGLQIWVRCILGKTETLQQMRVLDPRPPQVWPNIYRKSCGTQTIWN